MADDDTFSLRAFVREVAATCISPDIGVVAREVDAQIPPEHRDAALSQALRLFVRQVVSEQRLQTGIAPFTPGGPAGPPSSWKVTEVKAWQRALRDRVHVGGSDWKFFGDCTATDLTFASSE